MNLPTKKRTQNDSSKALSYLPTLALSFRVTAFPLGKINYTRYSPVSKKLSKMTMQGN